MKALSMKRMGLLMQYYWRTENNLGLVLYLISTAVYLLFIVAGQLDHKPSGFSSLIYWILCLSAIAHMFYWLEKKESAIQFLCLPASHLEKFLSRIVYVGIAIQVLQVAAQLTAGLCCAGFAIGMDFLAGNPYNPRILPYFILPVEHPVRWIIEMWNVEATFHGYRLLYVVYKVGIYSLLSLILYSLFTLCGLLFHRLGFVVATVVVLAFTATIGVYVGLLHGPGVNGVIGYILVFFGIATVGCYLLAYVSFCNQQIRKRWINI